MSIYCSFFDTELNAKVNIFSLFNQSCNKGLDPICSAAHSKSFQDVSMGQVPTL